MHTATILKILIASLSVIITGLILLQDRSSGAGGLFGGGSNTFYQKRRGMERTMFAFTAILIVVFIGLLIWNLVLQA